MCVCWGGGSSAVGRGAPMTRQSGALLHTAMTMAMDNGRLGAQARLAADGYVFLRGAVPQAAAGLPRLPHRCQISIMTLPFHAQRCIGSRTQCRTRTDAARAEVFGRLSSVGELEPGPDGVATGRSDRRARFGPPGAGAGSPNSVWWRSVSEGARLREATHGAACGRAAAAVLGESAVPHDYSYLRCVAAGQGKQSDLHLDHVFFGTRLATPPSESRPQLLTCWLALSNITPVDGGLFMLERYRPHPTAPRRSRPAAPCPRTHHGRARVPASF